MTEYLKSMEQQFLESLRNFNFKVEQIIKSPSENRENLVAETQNDIANADLCVKQMDLEAQALPQQMRIEAQQKIVKYKGDLQEARHRYQKCLELYLNQSQKEKLFGARNTSSTNAIDNSSGRYTNQFTADTVICKQNEMLNQAKQTGYSTIQVANNATTILKKDTETLNKQLLMAHEANIEIGQSNELVIKLENKRRRNRLIVNLILAIILVVFFIILLTYIL